ncbi:DUF2845 domain-containing protein [Ectothiorhodospiraceae bacterium 2226]|nr:DUF2845 domain-containing protein [Ectothiorhodospiraceae bacterium 2226]
MHRRLAIALLGLLGWAFSAAAEAGLRCDGRLVQLGDRQYDVLSLCGEPDYQTPLYASAHPYLLVPQVEEWQYNFGPHRFIRILRFQDGRLTQIRTGGYGYHAPARERCPPQTLRRGLSVIELLGRCGEPDHRELRSEQYLFDHRRHPPISVAVPVEDWYYEFGPGQFYRVVRLVDGQVVAVDTGRRR